MPTARACVNADEAERVVREVLPRVRCSVRLLVGGHPDQEDLVQASIVEILRALPGFRREASLKTWADRITYRTVMRQMKRVRRQEKRFVAQSTVDPAVEGSVHDGAFRRNLRHGLMRHLDGLSPKQREALVLRLVLGHSVQEVGEITRARVNTVRGRIRSGLRVLRESILGDPTMVTLLEEVRHGSK